MPMNHLHENVGQWLTGGGAESDVIISSRVRLARNVAGHCFMSRASLAEQRELAGELQPAVVDAVQAVTKHIGPAMGASEATWYDLETIPALDKQLLVERHLISREHAESEGPHGVAVAGGESLSVMVNEEDHLRMQSLIGGFEVDAAYELINELDDAIESKIQYAFDPSYGYLTACPTNVGTGMRVSVMLHLPALSMTRELQRVFTAAAKIDFIVRGLYGEGTQGHGDFYQVSNQKTLGRSETEILTNLSVVIPQIIRYERKVRDALFTEHRYQVEDRVCRAMGILSNARMISSEEAMHLLSQIRLGLNLGLVKDLDTATVNRLFVLTRPAHLQKLEGRELDAQGRDIARAGRIRMSLTGKSEPAGENSPEN
jgi:protein arginine kinase